MQTAAGATGLSSHRAKKAPRHRHRRADARRANVQPRRRGPPRITARARQPLQPSTLNRGLGLSTLRTIGQRTLNVAANRSYGSILLIGRVRGPYDAPDTVPTYSVTAGVRGNSMIIIVWNFDAVGAAFIPWD